MRIFKYLISLWIAVAVYTLLSFFGGPRGIPAYNYLLSEKDQLLKNIKELEVINEELEKTKNNLLYDHDTLLVYAHQIGYGYKDERFVRIVGLGNIKNTPLVTGKLYTAQNPEFVSDKNIKIAALFAGLLVFAFLFFIELIDSRSR
ncbi:MAG: septum formation initiator family protein [Treponema sp.]|jgi:hypothetical protein|nr:septum formation initiator family protein [Treponema sp.]